MEDIYEAIVAARKSGRRAVLATVVATRGSAPRKEGAKMLVKADGTIIGTVGGGSLEHQCHQEAMLLMGGASPKMCHFELTNEDAAQKGMVCGGIVDVFLEPLVAPPELFIFGGGHISLTLARIGKMCDFRVVVIDDRPEFANPERFPEADETIAGDISSVTGRLAINPNAYIVIVTRGHQHDAQALEWAAATGAAYVGMIGSRKKIATIYAHLKNRGLTQEQLDRVHAPIGLAIGAETPEEIAVSIMAQVIQIRRGESGGHNT